MKIAKNIAICLFCIVNMFWFIGSSKADEGMWIPSLLKYNIEDMHAKGFQLTANDLYSLNQPSLKDAIANVGGCTGEIVSNQGLLLTNHHCGLNQIQYHSSVEKDYLQHGFWAASPTEELPSNNMTAKIVVNIDDVTAEVTALLQNVTETQRAEKLTALQKQIIKIYTDSISTYEYSFVEMFGGNVYMVFTYEVFKDVRLVGAPPSAIGKFGGETDNWMWPRHTGDFCLFRIYADKDNKPAAYSKDNIPYTPKYHFKISTDGIEKGDFTFIYGFPARTTEYVPSYALDNVINESNPRRIKYRDIKLGLMKEFMDQSDEVRIKYVAKRSGVANAWKKWQGESLGLERLGAIGKKKAFEQQFTQWVNDSNKREYQHILTEFEQLYAEIKPYNKAADFYNEAFKGVEIFTPVTHINTLLKMYNKGEKDTEAYKNKQKEIQTSLALFYKYYHIPYDIKLYGIMLKDYTRALKNNIPNAFNNSIFAKSETAMELVNLDNKKIKQIKDDPFYQFYIYIDEKYDNTRTNLKRINNRLAVLQRQYIAAIMEMQPEHNFYPDANSTLRVAYGKVDGFNPVDGVTYNHYTTVDGIMEKNKTGQEDYYVPEKLKTLWQNKDYGHYTRKDGTMPVAFIASNHTTGGNSGSPLLNAKGELIGINFDRCWESTMSDYMFDPDFCRNISVDIRYVLFIIDKYANATHLIDEMELIKPESVNP